MDNRVFLFPVDNILLFKKVTLPFHIFEPRYIKMVQDSIDQDVPIGIVPGHSDQNYQGEICVAGLPHILKTYGDGRMDIFITGTVKCLLSYADQNFPYKTFHYHELEENLIVDENLSMELESLRNMLERWAMHFLIDQEQRMNFSQTLEDPEILVNYCAVFLLDELGTKRDVMVAETMRKKIQILLQALGPKEISLGPFMPTLKF